MVVPGDSKNITLRVMIIILILFGIFTIIWNIYIIPKQMKFNNDCESICNQNNLSYDSEFIDYPFNNVNGKCYCGQIKEECYYDINEYSIYRYVCGNLSTEWTEVPISSKESKNGNS